MGQKLPKSKTGQPLVYCAAGQKYVWVGSRLIPYFKIRKIFTWFPKSVKKLSKPFSLQLEKTSQ